MDRRLGMVISLLLGSTWAPQAAGWGKCAVSYRNMASLSTSNGRAHGGLDPSSWAYSPKVWPPSHQNQSAAHHGLQLLPCRNPALGDRARLPDPVHASTSFTVPASFTLP